MAHFETTSPEPVFNYPYEILAGEDGPPAQLSSRPSAADSLPSSKYPAYWIPKPRIELPELSFRDSAPPVEFMWQSKAAELLRTTLKTSKEEQPKGRKQLKLEQDQLWEGAFTGYVVGVSADVDAIPDGSKLLPDLVLEDSARPEENREVPPVPLTAKEFNANLATIIGKSGTGQEITRYGLENARIAFSKEEEPKLIRTVDIALKHFDFLEGLGNKGKNHDNISIESVHHTSKILEGEPLALVNAYKHKRTNGNGAGLGLGIGNFVGLAWMLSSDMFPVIPVVTSLVGGYTLGRIADRIYTTGEAVYKARPQVKALMNEFSDTKKI